MTSFPIAHMMRDGIRKAHQREAKHRTFDRRQADAFLAKRREKKA